MIRQKMPKDRLFSFQEVQLNDVLKELSNLDKSKANPSESIPTKIVLENLHIFGPKVTHDFNYAIKVGLFPDNLKLADVTPAYKKLSKHEKDNFRPVSILSALSKVFERLMDKQIGIYFQTILSIFLCGFRNRYSPQSCLIYLVEKWKRNDDS